MALHIMKQCNLTNDILARRGMRRDRVFRDRFNPLEQYDDDGLYVRYRFWRDGIVWLTQLLSPQIERRTRRNSAIPAIVQVCITLDYYATGSFQRSVSDGFGISQQACSYILHNVTRLIAARMSQYVKYPTTDQELASSKLGFYQLGGMPGIIGAVDGSHVCIQAPTINEFSYVNRKGYHSINMQAICNAQCIITNLVVKWPGSVHDSRIFRECDIYDDLEHGRKQGVLLGDAGYPGKQYLLVPYSNPAGPKDHQFNRWHSRHRVKIEQCFGRLKRRWHCLHSEMRYQPIRAVKIITACAVLHNKATSLNMPLIGHDEYADNDQPETDTYNGPVIILVPQCAIGTEIICKKYDIILCPKY